MAPLRLQIVVQPRTALSASGSGPSEPLIKWLEICPGNPTIQELSEILEARFYQRNHAALDIKILKFLDDVELYPSYKVRDIFEDLQNDKDGAKLFSTVKVYRNPPTAAQLSDPRRFESLPADSLARPRKRPLPPLFTDTARYNDREEVDHHDGSARESPDEVDRPAKRHKARQSSTGPFLDPDRPLDSLEGTLDCHDLSNEPRKYKSPRRQVEDSQRSPQRKRSNPYGTPISSQISPHEQAGPGAVEVISIPDTPPHHDMESRGTQSPEIPSSVELSSQAQGVFIKPELTAHRPQVPSTLATVKDTNDTVTQSAGSNGRGFVDIPTSVQQSADFVTARSNRSKEIEVGAPDHQTQSREESKRKAQAEFDRITTQAARLMKQGKRTTSNTTQRPERNKILSEPSAQRAAETELEHQKEAAVMKRNRTEQLLKRRDDKRAARQKLKEKQAARQETGKQNQSFHRQELDGEAQHLTPKQDQPAKAEEQKGTVLQHNHEGLTQRSPKARLNAEKQILIANQTLKRTRRGSTVRAESSLARPAEQSTRREAPIRERDRFSKPEEQPQAGSGGFTDCDALRAAGIDPGQQTVTPARPNRSSTAPLVGILKSTGSKSASIKIPLMREIDWDGRRTMTPPIPSLSMQSYPNSVEAKAATRARALSANFTQSPQTPIRNATGVTPRSLHRSVSFLESICSSQPEGDVPEATVQAAQPGKGMFHRAIKDVNGQADHSSPSTATKASNKPLARTTQTKMTQHISRDYKLKGKAVNSPSTIRPPMEQQIIISSESEASSFYSDESENERNGRAGPSSGRKTRMVTKVTTPHPSVKIKQEPTSSGPNRRAAQFLGGNSLAISSQSPAHERVLARDSKSPAGGVSQSPVLSGRHNDIIRASISAQRITPVPRKASSLRSSQTYSHSDTESRRSSTDDPALLPPRETLTRIPVTPGSTSMNGAMTSKRTNSGANQVSGSLKQSGPQKTIRSPWRKNDHQPEDEAGRQLQRENRQALEAHSSPGVSTSLSDNKKKAGPEQVSDLDSIDRRGRESYSTKVRRVPTRPYEPCTLSELRREQMARQEQSADPAIGVEKSASRPKTPEEISDASDSNDDSSSSVSNEALRLEQQAQGKPGDGGRSRLRKVFRELWGSKVT
ncbi:MAG: hypothetical protein Q9220_002470 [cf. Caloplaca sp. 1 TL-2023]